MIEYEKINLNLQSKKDCSCNKKIDIKNNCATPQCFKVDNYFSELIHNWEKEAARYNLGIQELEGIEYVTENNNGELLTKVIFKYRKGHELITREFYCAPAGPEGKPGKDGRDGDTGPQGPKGDKGDTPTLNKVILTWVNNCDDEGGRFIEDCLNNGYNLELKLKRPDVFEELSKILDLINEQLTQFYAKKSDLLDYVKNATFTNTITDILNKLSTAGAEYRLVYNAPWLYLTKDGKNVSSVKVEGGTSSGNSYYFTGSIFVYQIFPINYSEVPDIKKIVGSDWENKGWQKSLPDREDENNEAVWMATCNVESGSYGTWSYTKLTGANGIDGIDSDNLEFIYYRTNLSYVPNNDMPHITDPEASKPKPSNENKWLDHPQGVSEEYPYEFYSFTKKENGVWAEFSTPMIWSHYGRNGHDGDGVEYIFKTVNLVNTLINPTPINITYALYQKPEYVPSDWSDNPNSSLTSGQYLYVCQRTYRKVTQAHVNKYSEYGLTSEHIDSYMWLPFSDPAIWNYYAKDGEGSQGLAGAVIRTRGEWEAGQTYYRNCAEVEGGIKYIDIVLYDGKYYIVSLAQDGKSFMSCDSWRCDSENWTEATGFGFIATRALKADNAEINYLDTNEVRIWDSETRTAEHLVAGMTSGFNLLEEDPVKQQSSENPVRIWAGNVNNSGDVDLEKAPFKVYNDGSIVANDANITGDITLTSLTLANSNATNVSYYENKDNIDIYPESPDNHKIIYIFTNTILTTVTPKSGCTIIIKVNDVLQLYPNQITLDKNSVYILINTSIGWRLTLLDCINKVTTITRQSGWYFKPIDGLVSIDDSSDIANGEFTLKGTAPSFNSNDLPNLLDALWDNDAELKWSDQKPIYVNLKGLFGGTENVVYEYVFLCQELYSESNNVISNRYQLLQIDSTSGTPNIPEDLDDYYMLFVIGDEKYPELYFLPVTSTAQLSLQLLSAINKESGDNKPGLERKYTYTVEKQYARVIANGTVYSETTGKILGYMENVSDPESASIQNTANIPFILKYNGSEYNVSDSGSMEERIISGGEVQPANP